MLPSFKYLSKKLFTPKKTDRSRHSRVGDETRNSSTQVRPLVGELFSAIQPNVVESNITNVVASTFNPQGGFFTGASNFTLNDPTFIDNSQNTTYYIIANGFTVFLRLKDAGTPEAALDSAVRHPPPKCHPGSRRTINGRLEKWLLDLYRQRNMTWLYGPAGVGKSAVAQTFGELARERGCLGAAFFSAFNDLPTDSLRIIPTLAYQLAIHNPSYKQLITEQLAGDPSVLGESLPVQFQKLIIKPFSDLSSKNAQQPTTVQPYVVILDGLDEFDDEDAQVELIDLINNAAQRSDLPLIWLLCSRPESHITYTFSRLKFVRSCEREELVIDDEARADVEKFLRDNFRDIHMRYQFVIAVDLDAAWPPEEVFDKISKAVSGYFVFASVVARVVGDRIAADPEGQLLALMKMLQGLDDIGMKNPLEALDIFYSRILSRIPEHILPTAIQVLGICARGEPSESDTVSAEWFWLFLRIGRTVFYRSLEKLHSVVRVPSPKEANHESLSFYHKSFADYLRRQRRSEKFFISDAEVKVLLGINSLYLYSHVLVYESPDLVGTEEHRDSEAMLQKWSSIDLDEINLMRLAARLGSMARRHFNESLEAVTEADTDFFNALSDFKFELVNDGMGKVLVRSLMHKVHIWDWSRTSAGPHFIRTKVFDEVVDPKLLHYLSILTKGKPIPPLEIQEPVIYHRGQPLPWRGPQAGTMGYAIIGRGLKSCLLCCYKDENILRLTTLGFFTPPTALQISECREWMEKAEQFTRKGFEGRLTQGKRTGTRL